MSEFTNSFDYRRVRYIGDHPQIRGRVGDSYFDLRHKCDLFRPDVSGEGNSHWYRVWEENLIAEGEKWHGQN